MGSVVRSDDLAQRREKSCAMFVCTLSQRELSSLVVNDEHRDHGTGA